MQNKLIERLQYALRKTELLELTAALEQEGCTLEQLLSIVKNEKNPVAFHAAWVIENMVMPNPEKHIAVLPLLCNEFIETTNDSVQRHFAKILSHLLTLAQKGQLGNAATKWVNAIDTDPIIERCIELISNPQTKIAVAAHCIDIIYTLSHRVDWLQQELPFILESQISIGSAGIQSRCRNILKKMSKKKVTFF